MKDKETIKALEWCSNNRSCGGCPNRADKCTIESDALALINRLKAQNKEFDEKIVIQRGAIDWQAKEINRQKAEIEQWKEEANKYQSLWCEAVNDIQTAKSEAIKEFAEKVETDLDKRVSKNIRNRNPHWYIAKRIVRETAIEMTEQSVNYESSKTDEQ